MENPELMDAQLVMQTLVAQGAGGLLLIFTSEGPWAVVTAPTGAVGVTAGIGNMVAAFAPEEANDIASLMLNAPSTPAQIGAYVVAGEKGQTIVSLGEAMWGLGRAASGGDDNLEFYKAGSEWAAAWNDAANGPIEGNTALPQSSSTAPAPTPFSWLDSQNFNLSYTSGCD